MVKQKAVIRRGLGQTMEEIEVYNTIKCPPCRPRPPRHGGVETERTEREEGWGEGGFGAGRRAVDGVRKNEAADE